MRKLNENECDQQEKFKYHINNEKLNSFPSFLYYCSILLFNSEFYEKKEVNKYDFFTHNIQYTYSKI